MKKENDQSINENNPKEFNQKEKELKRFVKKFLKELDKTIKINKQHNNQANIKKEIIKIKQKLVKDFNLRKIPANYEILFNLSDYQRKKYSRLLKFLSIKPTRTLSGVAPVAIMTYPFPCPHGKCITCPGGPNSNFGDVPQSYTGKEPATLRAIRNNYDPYLQVFNRLQQYALLNQNFQKVELIIMGGTFLSFPIRYQYDFITNAYNALNDFSKYFFKGNKFLVNKFKSFFEINHNKDKTTKIIEKIKQLKESNKDNLEKAKKRNEHSKVKAVALCIETRPDYCYEEHINRMLEFGTTRVEIGVQSVFEDVLKAMNRGHGVKEIIKATQLAKDSFLKVTYHMMLGLPGSSYEKDLEAFKILFKNEEFRPDALKIYPTRVIEGTGLWELYKQRKYKPLELNKTIELLIRIKQIIPRYCRIMRIQRDIPDFIGKGVTLPNIREVVNQKLDQLIELKNKLQTKKITKNEVDKKLKELKLESFKNDIENVHKCQCIRCREISRKLQNQRYEIKKLLNNIEFAYHHYKASKGKEVFIELRQRDLDALIGFVRLRMPYKPFRPEIDNSTAGIRQLHVYGKALKLNTSSDESFQHKGFGRMLMNEAERIAKEEFGAGKILVISGVGVRQYYRKLGYRLKGPYMYKKL